MSGPVIYVLCYTCRHIVTTYVCEMAMASFIFMALPLWRNKTARDSPRTVRLELHAVFILPQLE